MPQPQQAGPDLASAVTARQAEAMEPAAPAELSDLATACGQCHRCGLADSRQQVVVGRGNPSARLLLIGEAPGAEEDVCGQPFVGRAGRLLEQLLAEAGLDSERDLSIANVIKCRPPGNRKPSRVEIASCRPWLDHQIAWQRPALIGLLGATALEAILGLKGGITKRRGQWLQLREGLPQPIPPSINPGQPMPPNPLERSTTGPMTQATTQQQEPPQSLDRTGNQTNERFIHLEAIHLQQALLMPLLHPSYLLRNPSDQEGSPKWHTLRDLKELRRRLDELAAGAG